MGLSSHLLETYMSLPCSRCGREIVKLGKWFKSVHKIDCPYCEQEIEWDYEHKLRLFHRYEVMLGGSAPQGASGADGHSHL